MVVMLQTEPCRVLSRFLCRVVWKGVGEDVE